MWDVSESGGNVADAPAGFFADGSAAVKDARDSSDGDVGLSGNVLDGDHRSGVGRGAVPRACSSVIRRQFRCDSNVNVYSANEGCQ